MGIWAYPPRESKVPELSVKNGRQIPEILRESPGFVPGIARFHPGNRPVSSRESPGFIPGMPRFGHVDSCKAHVGISRAGQHFDVQLGKSSTWQVVRLECVDVVELINIFFRRSWKGRSSSVASCGLMRTHVGLMWTHVGLMWTHVDSCGLMWDSCGLMWTHVGLMWTHVGLMWTHVGLMWTHVGLMWIRGGAATRSPTE